jgi:hypothetical protein
LPFFELEIVQHIRTKWRLAYYLQCQPHHLLINGIGLAALPSLLAARAQLATVAA